MRIVLPLLAAVLSAASVTATAQTAVNGSLLKLDGKSYRLWGIETLEGQQACADGWPGGAEAKATLRGFLRNSHVDCEARATDADGRTIALCKADGDDLGAEMVATGMALTVPQTGSEYVTEEAKAKEERLGLHAHDCAAAWAWQQRIHKSR